MTTTEVGKRLGVSARRVRELLDRGRLRFERIGPLRVVQPAEVERFAQEQAEQAAGKKRGPLPNVLKKAGKQHDR